MNTPHVPWVARESFVGRLVGEHVDVRPLPPPPRAPEFDPEEFAEMEDDDA
jgi:hypothetical protein